MNKTMMINILSILANNRPVFHSEADFQHELAFLIHEELKKEGISIRVEKPLELEHSLIYCDIYFQYKSMDYAIELKYKTKKLETTVAGEKFNIATHAATNLARYDFLSDLSRIEQLKEQKKITNGYAIFLTNDSSYWNDNSNTNLTGKQFYFSENFKKPLTGKLRWENNPPHSSIGSQRQKPLILKHIYHPEWRQYSIIDNTIFRYLMFEV